MLLNLTIMGMHTYKYTQRYFQKYKCRILTRHVMPFRNSIATLYSLVPLTLIFVPESKNICLSPSIIFCKDTNPWSTEISSSSDRTFLMKPFQKYWSYLGYLSKTEKVSSIISFHCSSVFIRLKLQFWNESCVWPVSKPSLYYIAFPAL